MIKIEGSDRQEEQDEGRYYRALEHYSPLCYWGKGVPLLMTHQYCYTSLPFIIVADALFVLFIVAAINKGVDKSEADNIALVASVFVCSLHNLSYLATLMLNPGIVAEYHCIAEELTRYCQACNRRITKGMKHCKQCGVCVTDLDHHCGFFGKCIAGNQRYPFYAFMLLTVVAMIVLIASLGSLAQ